MTLVSRDPPGPGFVHGAANDRGGRWLMCLQVIDRNGYSVG